MTEPTTAGAGPAALGRLEEQLEELGEYIHYYFSAQLDSAKVSLRRAALAIGAAILVLAAASSLVGVCVTIAVLGVANLLGATLGDRLWAGYLIVGVSVLAAIAIGIYFAVSRLERSLRQRTVDRYTRRRREQKERFGHDVKEQAATAHRNQRG